MCLIGLLIDVHTQNGLTAKFKMLKLNFEKENHRLGMFDYVLLQIVVARRYDESRSTIVRLVKRDFVIGTSIVVLQRVPVYTQDTLVLAIPAVPGQSSAKRYRVGSACLCMQSNR